MLYTTVDRKIALTKAGVVPADVARDLGVSETLVSLVVAGKRTTGPAARRVMDRLASLTGVPVNVLFPGATAPAP